MRERPRPRYPDIVRGPDGRYALIERDTRTDEIVSVLETSLDPGELEALLVSQGVTSVSAPTSTPSTQR